MGTTEPDDAETLRRFFAPDGRLHTMPTRHLKRRLLTREDNVYWRSGGTFAV